MKDRTNERRPPVETIAPARNFTITTAERVRALSGPPAYIVRRRTIEDLEAALVDMIADLLATGDDAAIAAGLKKRAITVRLARANTLVAAHNKYYPCEANLPMDPRTGQMLERGAPWRPLEPLTLEQLLTAARDRVLRNP